MNGRERQLHLRHVAGHLERACASDESQPHSTKQNTAASRAREKTESQVDTDLRERPDERGVPDKECDHTSGERPAINTLLTVVSSVRASRRKEKMYRRRIEIAGQEEK
jgi:hypothetical protein